MRSNALLEVVEEEDGRVGGFVRKKEEREEGRKVRSLCPSGCLEEGR